MNILLLLFFLNYLILFKIILCNININNSFDSDYLLFSIFNSNITNTNNLFSNSNINIGSFICEYRGNITPINSISLKWYDPYYIITSLHNEKYLLSSNNICGIINDCFNLTSYFNNYTNEYDYYYKDCKPNVQLYHRDGKLYLIALEDIQPNTELFVARGLDYWKFMMNQLGFITPPYNIKLNFTNSLTIDLDELNLFQSKSLLVSPYSGTGIFAKFNIPINTVLCEYRGETFLSNASITSNKWSSLITVNGIEYKSIGTGFCSIINDPSDIKPYTKDELMNIIYNPMNTSEYTIPLMKGFSPNVARAGSGPKSFIVSIKDIDAGAELFYFYGK